MLAEDVNRGRNVAKRCVLLVVQVPQRRLPFCDGGKLVRHLPIKGLYDAPVSFGTFVSLMTEEARTQDRRLRYRRLRRGHA